MIDFFEVVFQPLELRNGAKGYGRTDRCLPRYFLRNGHWPRNGVVTLGKHAEVKERAAAAAERKARANAEAASQAVEKARKHGLERRCGPTIDTIDEAGLAELGRILAT